MEKNLTRFVIAALFSLATGPLAAQIEGFEESFSGKGDYQSVGGAFDGLDNPGWVIVGEGLITESGYEFNLVSDSDPVQDIIRRPVYGQGSYLQQIVLQDLIFGDVDAGDFGAGSTVALHHYFTVGDLTKRAIVSLFEPEEEGVWQLTLATTGPTFQREVAFVPKGGDYVSLSLRYDHQLSTLSGLYDPDMSDNQAPVVLTMPIEIELSEESETRL
jgi:hypothetical protein